MARVDDRLMAGITFEEWGSVDQHAARRLARDPDVKPLAMRVMFAAVGWSNLIGHAEFASGGLALVLQNADPKTGEISIPSRNQVNAAIRRAEQMGLVGDESSRFCLLAPTWWEKSGGTGGKTCNHHGIKRRHRRGVATEGERHKRSVAATQEVCRPEPLTSANVQALSDSDLSRPHDDRKSA